MEKEQKELQQQLKDSFDEKKEQQASLEKELAKERTDNQQKLESLLKLTESEAQKQAFEQLEDKLQQLSDTKSKEADAALEEQKGEYETQMHKLEQKYLKDEEYLRTVLTNDKERALKDQQGLFERRQSKRQVEMDKEKKKQIDDTVAQLKADQT